MKAGHSINRPVLARRLELDKRRRDYKIHLRTLKEQKCGTDFSHPPVVFRIQTVQKNSNAKRKERKRYEDMCIEKMNEHYANKVMNSKSFHDPYLIEQLNKKCTRRVSPSSSQLMSPQVKSPIFQSTKSVKSTSSNPNKINENECNNKYDNLSEKKSNKVDKYNIPHYNLPPEVLKFDINLEEDDNKEQNPVPNRNFEFQFNQILENVAEKIETENNNNEETFDIHPPEGDPHRTPSRSNNSLPAENEVQINNEKPENNNNEETFEIRPPEGEPRKNSSRSSNVQPAESEIQINNENTVDNDAENFEDF